MTSVWVAPSNDFPLTSRISSPISKSALSAGDPGLKKKKKEKKKRANQSAGPVAMAALAPPQMRRPVAVLDRLDRRVFDERFNNDNRSNIRSV